MNKHITEIIPDFSKMPDWAHEAFEDGQYFVVVAEKVISYEATIKELEAKLEAAEENLLLTHIDWQNKSELENLLEDVVNELDLSDSMFDKHGPLGTAPSEMVRLVLERKDLEIALLKAGFISPEITGSK